MNDEVILALLRFTLLLWGFVYLVTQSFLLRPVRILFSRYLFTAMLVYCPACTGAWIGIAIASQLPWSTAPYLQMIESGLASMALGAIWGQIFGDSNVFEMEHRFHRWKREEGDADGGGTGGTGADGNNGG